MHKISCECGPMYTEQTKRPLKIGLVEQKYSKNNEGIIRSEVANHCWYNNNIFKFSEGSTIQKCSSIHDFDF